MCIRDRGIGGAIAFTLYKPIFEKDSQTINEIVSVQGWLYPVSYTHLDVYKRQLYHPIVFIMCLLILVFVHHR